MIKKMKKWKIRTKLSVLLVLTGILCIVQFWFLWYNRWNVWNLCSVCFPELTVDHNQLADRLNLEAVKLDLPESEDDKEAIEKLEPLFALLDDYTSMHIYGIEDGLYRAGSMPGFIERSNPFYFFFNYGYLATGGDGEDQWPICIQFKNGPANAYLTFYHRTRISYPWFLFSIIFSILTFLVIILFFVSRKMKHIISLKNEILFMASGNLTHSVPAYGEDEIGILSKELDHLRLTLDENIRQEQQSRQANQDLITALSHDLRTPLTILNGYLEVLRLKRNPDMQEEYLNRCLQKTAEIKEMTDRMFEYALVSEGDEAPDIVKLPANFIQCCVQENSDYIRLVGFDVHLTFPDASAWLLGDETMIKRIFNNLFSNILKYGDKKAPVTITGAIHQDTLKIQITNSIKQEHTQTESSHIGLKSVEKMLKLMDGEMQVLEKNCHFTVQLLFPL